MSAFRGMRLQCGTAPISAIAVGACGPGHSGAIFLDGATTGSTIGTITSGTVVGIAVDCDQRLIWFRSGAAGNWNGSAGANPATGVGGILVTAQGRGIPIYPTAWLIGGSEQTTANFGDTAFVGAVPSGYTSGFTANIPPSNTVLLVHADGANGSTTFTDVSPSAHTLTSITGLATVSTSQVKFGFRCRHIPRKRLYLGHRNIGLSVRIGAVHHRVLGLF